MCVCVCVCVCVRVCIFVHIHTYYCLHRHELDSVEGPRNMYLYNQEITFPRESHWNFYMYGFDITVPLKRVEICICLTVR